jgi:NADH-quinone oxidoreductase subunit H
MFDFNFLFTAILIVAVVGALLGLCAYLTLAERKVSAWMQDRLGPNRVGPWGLLQPIVDGAKFLLKEDIIPGHVDRVFYLLAPAIAMGTAMFAFAVVPFGPTTAPPAHPWPQSAQEQADIRAANPGFEEQVKDYNESWSRVNFVIAPRVDVGFVFIFAVGSLAVYGVILGGWSSNSKYSLLGGLRSSAQLISYEIPMGMSVLGIVLLAGSLNMERIIDRQVYQDGWYFFYQPLAFLLFLTSVFAECNRLPFDLPEAEQELVGGYHTEYSSMKFAMFYLGEYVHMVTTSFLVATLFLGGWYFPVISGPEAWIVVKVIVFGLKMLLFILLYMAIRWTILRFRFDQLMGMAWRGFIPLGLLNLLGVMVVEHYHWPRIVLPLLSIVLFVGAGFVVVYYRTPRLRETITVYRGHKQVEIPMP